MIAHVRQLVGARRIEASRIARSRARVTLSLALLVATTAAPVAAQRLVAPMLPVAIDTSDANTWSKHDAHADPTLAPLAHDVGGPRLPTLRRDDGWKLAGMGTVALLLSTADRRGDAWARRSDIRDGETLRALSRAGDVTGTWVSVGVGPASYLLGRARNDSGTAVLGLRTSEAVFTSGVAIQLIKLIAGRRRPYASVDNSPTHWDLFGGRSDSTRSFASQHAAMSAAAAVTLAAEWRRQGVRGWQAAGPPIAYALATLTAGSRVRDRQHWLSDVVAGSAVGVASALLVRRWHDANPRSRIDRVLLPH